MTSTKNDKLRNISIIPANLCHNLIEAAIFQLEGFRIIFVDRKLGSSISRQQITDVANVGV